MTRTLLSLFLLFNCILYVSNGIGQSLDSADVKPFYFDQTAIDKYKNDSDYQYDRPPPERVGWLDATKQAIKKWLGKIFTTETSWQILRVIMWILAIALLVFIIYQLFKKNINGFFLKKSDKSGLDYQLLDENIHEIDFEDEINKAINDALYRYAIRLYFLRHLKYLSDSALINWTKNKTNGDYLHEIEEPLAKSNFTMLVYIFEHVWYGENDVSESQFKALQKVFTKQSQTI